MTKQEIVKWSIRALNSEVNKNSHNAWRHAGALDAMMVMDGHIKAGAKMTYMKVPSVGNWDNERNEYYPEAILRMALEHYLKID